MGLITLVSNEAQNISSESNFVSNGLITLETFSYRSEHCDQIVDTNMADVSDLANRNDVTFWYGGC